MFYWTVFSGKCTSNSNTTSSRNSISLYLLCHSGKFNSTLQIRKKPKLTWDSLQYDCPLTNSKNVIEKYICFTRINTSYNLITEQLAANFKVNQVRNKTNGTSCYNNRMVYKKAHPKVFSFLSYHSILFFKGWFVALLQYSVFSYSLPRNLLVLLQKGFTSFFLTNDWLFHKCLLTNKDVLFFCKIMTGYFNSFS